MGRDPLTRFVTTPDGVRLAYDEAGTGEPVVLVHGLGLSRRRWQAQVEALAAAGLRAIRYDHRGFGASETPPGAWGMEELVADLGAVADALGARPFHLVGHSLGGMVALRYAVERPDDLRSLTVLSSTAHNGRRATAFARAMARVCREGFDAAVADPAVRSTLEGVLAEAFPSGSPPVELLRQGFERPNPAQALAWEATAGFSVKDRLHRIRCPVLVLHGTADPLIPFVVGQAIHWLLPGSRFVPLEGAGHSIQVERAGEVNRALLEFLRLAGR